MSTLLVDLVLFGGFVLIVSLALAPLESLGWWAGWLGPEHEPEDEPDALRATPLTDAASTPRPDYFIVYLSGIGSISGDELLPQEADFLDRLQEALPEAKIVRDVFPYAPSGRPLLTGQRVFTWLWRRVRRWRLSGRHVLPALLNIRNLFQVLVSADHRYGPLYSFAIAGVVRERLAAHGYGAGSGAPVVLLGFSGGGQISAGSATYLDVETGAPLAIVTLGGVMAADRGIGEVDRLVSLFGAKDRVYQLGRAVFPGRWPAAPASSWNAAARESRLSERVIGPMGHAGRGGYLDESPRPDGGPSFFDTSVREVAAAMREVSRALKEGPRPLAAPAAQEPS